MSLTPSAAANRYNENINAGDIRALATLMSEDHRLIDVAGNIQMGKSACIAAWIGFFKAFPGYHNRFDSYHEFGSVATMTGYSDCPNHPEMTGPAIWTATVMADRLTEWRVYQDTVHNRIHLGIYE
jgi:ketosteroid isomerase-like protein